MKDKLDCVDRPMESLNLEIEKNFNKFEKRAVHHKDIRSENIRVSIANENFVETKKDVDRIVPCCMREICNNKIRLNKRHATHKLVYKNSVHKRQHEYKQKVRRREREKLNNKTPRKDIYSDIESSEVITLSSISKDSIANTYDDISSVEECPLTKEDVKESNLETLIKRTREREMDWSLSENFCSVEPFVPNNTSSPKLEVTEKNTDLNIDVFNISITTMSTVIYESD